MFQNINVNLFYHDKDVILNETYSIVNTTLYDTWCGPLN